MMNKWSYLKMFEIRSVGIVGIVALSMCFFEEMR